MMGNGVLGGKGMIPHCKRILALALERSFARGCFALPHGAARFHWDIMETN
jgi:hypothetical protein